MLTLRCRVAVTATFGFFAMFVMGTWLAGVLHTHPPFPWLAGAVFVSGMLLVLAAAPGHHPFPTFGAANLVTTTRLMLVALVGGLMLEPASARVAWWVVSLAVIGTALDGVDGWLARRAGMSSPLGARFDLETDALCILLLSVLVWQFDKAGAWVLACGLMRYLFVAAGWLLPWMAGPLTPTWRGKAVAVIQLAGLGVALAPVVRAPASTFVAAATLGALVWSFSLDVARLWRQRPER